MNYQLFIQYKINAKSNQIISLTTDYINVHDCLKLIYDLTKTSRLHHVDIYDEQDTAWTVKQLEKSMEKEDELVSNLTLHFDGSYNVETKKAGIGISISYSFEGKNYRLNENAVLDYLNSSSEAEYAALHYGLTVLEQFDNLPVDILIVGDSLGLIMQLQGEWPCYDEELNKWLDKIQEKITNLKLFAKFENVSRKENSLCDQLANQALNNIHIQSIKEM